MFILPQTFRHKFKLEKNENLDEYMKEAGISWPLRKVALMLSLSMRFQHVIGDDYIMQTMMSIKNIDIKFTMNEWAAIDGMDGKKHQVKFWLENETTLVETVKALKEGENDDIIKYIIAEDGQLLICEFEKNGVVGRRFLRKTDSE